MNLIERIWQSSLGKKYVMAVTGVALFVFVVGHLVGNLQVFGPPDLINTYAHFLKSKPGLLWGARLGLLVCVALHIAAAVGLTMANREARPVQYVGDTGYGSTTRSRYMLVSGLVILAFIIYHLAHFTALLPGINGSLDFRKLTTELHGENVADVYAMMILGFQVWWVVLFYLIAQALLFMHLGHGLAAMFQSVGFRNHVWWPRIELFARIASIAIFAGYALIPIAIYMRMVGADYAEKARLRLSAGPAMVRPMAAGVKIAPELSGSGTAWVPVAVAGQGKGGR
jgi:succinate dehydrogenase / fumarate reductase cytochrome b subunit